MSGCVRARAGGSDDSERREEWRAREGEKNRGRWTDKGRLNQRKEGREGGGGGRREGGRMGGREGGREGGNLKNEGGSEGCQGCCK